MKTYRQLARSVATSLLAAVLTLLTACGGRSDSSQDAVSGGSGNTVGIFPSDFIWGVSSSAFQVEGGDVDANWNRYNARGTQDPYGASVDFRHRYAEDIALADGLGVNTYRISISWARVEPREGEFSEEELKYYDDVIANMKRRGIKPMVTLSHWDYPGWLLDQGGFVNSAAVPKFLNYARTIITRFGKDVDLWITFNETLFFVIQELGLRYLDPVSLLMMNENVLAAHRQVYDLIHELDDKAMVSSNVAWFGDKGFASVLQLTDAIFMERAKDKMDFLGFDYYYTNFTPGDFLNSVRGTPWESSIDPFQMYSSLVELARRYPDLPLLIVENGMPTNNGGPRSDGATREDVLRDTVYWVQRARADGINIMGFIYWSLTDNFEWGTYGARFGLYTVDVLTDPTLTRKPTAAVAAYREITGRNGIPTDYVPVLGPDCTEDGAMLDPRCLIPQ